LRPCRVELEDVGPFTGRPPGEDLVLEAVTGDRDQLELVPGRFGESVVDVGVRLRGPGVVPYGELELAGLRSARRVAGVVSPGLGPGGGLRARWGGVLRRSRVGLVV